MTKHYNNDTSVVPDTLTRAQKDAERILRNIMRRSRFSCGVRDKLAAELERIVLRERKLARGL